ncbi:hypothetical protein D9Q98_004865 [Chlorella vulgaris]|uniref:Uncharacterized protein n=1 Tax=Chlorella vulgaris TaxID=3077 RepID=A0A9D4TNF7_CHLVU|nr:hypothetical protein D9Q98_004865 [Chlorella vulgaris]
MSQVLPGAGLPPGAAPASGPLTPVVDVAYCVPGQVTLKAKEKSMSISGDNFTVIGPDGSAWFKVDAKMFSMREKRVLLDAAGRPAAALQKKLISLKPAWQLFRGGDFSGQPIATIKQKLMTLKPCVEVYLEGDKEADFKCKGNFRSKKFEVIALAGGQEREIAKIHKESRFSSASAYAKSMFSEADSYFIEATPGSDLAFLSALCIAIDELFQDAKS